MSVDVSHLSPSDAVAALRSYPRRYRALLTPLDPDEKPDDLPYRPGDDGHSAVEHADHAARAVALIADAVHEVLVSDRPVLMPAVIDETARDWAAGLLTVDSVLDFVTVECEVFADAIERVSASEWTRGGLVAGRERELTALDLVREAVRTGSDHLRAAERALESARRRP